MQFKGTFGFTGQIPLGRVSHVCRDTVCHCARTHDDEHFTQETHLQAHVQTSVGQRCDRDARCGHLCRAEERGRTGGTHAAALSPRTRTQRLPTGAGNHPRARFPTGVRDSGDGDLPGPHAKTYSQPQGLAPESHAVSPRCPE